MTETERNIINLYEKYGSVTAAMKNSEYSRYRITKILASNGYVLSDVHAKILKLHEKGKSVEEIANIVGYTPKVIQSYLPMVRPVYKEQLSINSKRIAKCRELACHNGENDAACLKINKEARHGKR